MIFFKSKALSVVEDVDKLETSNIAERNVNCPTTLEDRLVVAQKS